MVPARYRKGLVWKASIFGEAFERQNLGVPLESLQGNFDGVPLLFMTLVLVVLCAVEAGLFCKQLTASGKLPYLVIPINCGKLRDSFVAIHFPMCDTNIVFSEERKQITKRRQPSSKWSASKAEKATVFSEERKPIANRHVISEERKQVAEGKCLEGA